jgi:hypothetical protein
LYDTKSAFMPFYFLIVWSKLRVNGLALFPFIIVQRPNPSKRLINHERIHLRQQLEMLVLPFYIWYLFEYLIRYASSGSSAEAYWNLSFEREAYQNDQSLAYLKKRRFWAFLKYM